MRLRREAPADKMRTTSTSRDVGELLLSVKTGPFYGIRCTINMQVMNADNEVIDGLHCVGSMVGDMYNNCYSSRFPGRNLGGTCPTFDFDESRSIEDAFARCAGRSL